MCIEVQAGDYPNPPFLLTVAEKTLDQIQAMEGMVKPFYLWWN